MNFCRSTAQDEATDEVDDTNSEEVYDPNSESSEDQDDSGSGEDDEDGEVADAGSVTSSEPSTPLSCAGLCQECEKIKDAFSDLGVPFVSCAAHTLQLSVDDALKRTAGISKVIRKARKLVRKLRTNKYARVVKSKGPRRAVIDVDTHWNSISVHGPPLQIGGGAGPYCHGKSYGILALLLWARLIREAEPENLLSEPETSVDIESEEVAREDVEEMLKEIDSTASTEDNAVDIASNLVSYRKWKRVPKDEDVLQFWETKKRLHPELYLVATTLLAIPMTSVSVERFFSHLRQILLILRHNLGPSLFKDILVVKCNKIFCPYL
ncbi:hypothetical protein FOCC_FOCC010950 [Frankliniella occidentalis]|nr:hypothetical protein FOCC_FOCC010950 [Frankliniella occidentalis]